MNTTEKETVTTPPYCSFKSFGKLTEQFRSGTPFPDFIHPSVLREGYSGFDKSALPRALRWLGLTDEKNRPSERFHALVSVENDYPKQLETLIREAYSEILGDTNLKTMTIETLRGQFKDHGSSESTMTKSISFLLGACSVAQIEVSPHIMRRSSGNATRKPRKKNAALRKKSSKKSSPRKEERSLDEHGEISDLTAGYLKFQIAIPDFPDGTLTLPKGMAKGEWQIAKKMISVILETYTEGEGGSP